MDECKHGMVTGTCTICSKKDRGWGVIDYTPPPRRITTAKYAGKCLECGEWYQEGDPIVHDGDSWIHDYHQTGEL